MIEARGVGDPVEVRRILEERAAELARPPESAERAVDVLTVVVVTLGPERYGIPIERVREVRPVARVTPLPAMAPFWLGLANVRGALVPVLDLARYLGHHADLPADEPQLVVLHDASLTLAVRVDSVPEVRTLSRSAFGRSLVEATSDRPHVHAGLTGDLLALLDVDALLSDGALVVADEVN
jgi:purine-binding chemotaxis protein CheW